MKDLANFLHNIAVESGEIVPGAGSEQMLNELLIDESIAVGDPTVAETISNADASTDIANQLDDLADRAEAIAEQQKDTTTAPSPAVVEVSIESMHREFNTIMRANKLDGTFKASSFEAAGSDADRLTGLVRDARRVSQVTRDHAKQLKDFSSEGKIMQFLRGDKSRLEKAHATLNTSMVKVQRGLDELKDEPKILKHQGLGRWLTVEGKPVTSLKKAVADEAAWLSKANAAVINTLEGLKAAASKLKNDPTIAVDTLLPASMFSAINGLSTIKGELLGNTTIAGVSDGEKVFKYKRSNEFKVTAGDVVKSAAKGALGLGIIAFGATSTGLAVPFAGGYVGGSVLKSAINGVSDKGNETEAMSVANPSDLKAVINTILGYNKYLQDFDAELTEIMEVVDEMDNNKEARPASSAIFDAVGRCTELAEVIYDQAIYTTTNAATLLQEVA